jgi:hypothetical protein
MTNETQDFKVGTRIRITHPRMGAGREGVIEDRSPHRDPEDGFLYSIRIDGVSMEVEGWTHVDLLASEFEVIGSTYGHGRYFLKDDPPAEGMDG